MATSCRNTGARSRLYIMRSAGNALATVPDRRLPTLFAALTLGAVRVHSS